MNEAIITSDIIVKGFVITEREELIEKYKKIFPNHYIEKYEKSFFFMDLDRIISVKPFPGSINIEYVQLILKPFMGELNYRLTRVITMEGLNEIKKLLIQRNRYDILFNLEA
jgi:hypothetical protein